MSQRAFAMVALLSCVVGCDTTTLPPAEAPSLYAPWTVQGRFACWGEGTRQCYLAEDEATASESNEGFGANFALHYNPVNGRTLTVDGHPVLETASSQPPADEDTYTLDSAWRYPEPSDPDDGVVEGAPEGTLLFYPARAPRTPAHGEVSVLTMTTTSGNPLYQGTNNAEASTQVEFTYVSPGRCHVQAVDMATTAEPDERIEIGFSAEGCKRLSLYVYGVNVPTHPLPGSNSSNPAPAEWTDTDAIEDDLSDVLRLHAPPAGGYVSAWAVAEDALGKTFTSNSVLLRVPVDEDEEVEDPTTPDDCVKQPFTVESTCNVGGSMPIVSLLTLGACTEEEAIEAATQSNEEEFGEDANCTVEIVDEA